MKLRDADRVLVLGITGSGKSHYAKRKIVREAARVVVWDIYGEYADECDLDEVGFGELSQEPELIDADECRLAVVPDWDDTRELAQQFSAFKTILKNAQHEKQLVVAIEECALLRPDADGALVALAAQSRHWKMPLILLAQRATMVPPGARSQASIVVSFRQNDPGDLTALEERIGERLTKEVKALPKHKFVVWSQEQEFSAPRSPRIAEKEESK